MVQILFSEEMVGILEGLTQPIEVKNYLKKSLKIIYVHQHVNKLEMYKQ